MWLIYTFITTILWGIGELFYKKGSYQNEKYSHLKTSIFVGIVMGIHALIVLLVNKNLNFDFRNLYIYLPVSLCYMLSMTCSYFGVRFIEESISDPIENSSGAIVPILCAVILKESIQPLSIIAIIVIAIGMIGVSALEKGSNRHIELGKKLAIFAFAMPFCYALLDATGTFLDIYYLDIDSTLLLNVTSDTIEDVANTCYELSFFFLSIILFIFIKIKKVKLFSLANECIDSDKFIVNFLNQKYKMIASICELGGQLAYVYALNGNGAIAAPIIGAGVVILSLMLSRIILKEKLSKLQYVFILLVLCGIIILSIIEV